MKVIHVSYCFYPDPSGGTEIYVAGLAKRLEDLGVQSIIAAPADKSASYVYDGLSVRRYSFSAKINDLSELYDEGDPVSALEFGKILDEEKPDIVHIHALTRAVSIYIVREAKKRGLPVIFTYHTPTVSCQCGLLLRWKNQICDGKIRPNLCAMCTLNRHGLHRGLAFLFSTCPAFVCWFIRRLHLSGKIFTALRMHCLLSLRKRSLDALLREVDQFVAVSKWVYEVLKINGVPKEKIFLSAHGLYYHPELIDQKDAIPVFESPLKIIYLGRIDWTKGLHFVIKALKLLPEIPIELHIYGIMQDKNAEKYLLSLKRAARRDKRVSFYPPVQNDKIIPLLKEYHYLIAPSIWLETGPLVVLEAFLAKVPVIGSNLGGIAELVEDGMNSLLVKHGSVKAWRNVLLRVSTDRKLITRLRSGIKSPRRMQDVAMEMKALYDKFAKTIPGQS
ncbi:MAG: glycosyltransferase [Candidatus Omnitrophica bacterium]|nr:glycosyltransferase [Candidatus Omnitrophota bacterium]